MSLTDEERRARNRINHKRWRDRQPVEKMRARSRRSYQRWRERNPGPGQGVRHSAELKNSIIAMWEDDYSAAQIGLEVNLSRSAVLGIIHRFNKQ